jgi:hypothetical protein
VKKAACAAFKGGLSRSFAVSANVPSSKAGKGCNDGAGNDKRCDHDVLRTKKAQPYKTTDRAMSDPISTAVRAL